MAPIGLHGSHGARRREKASRQVIAFAVVGSLGRLRSSEEAPEAARFLFQACDKRR